MVKPGEQYRDAEEEDYIITIVGHPYDGKVSAITGEGRLVTVPLFSLRALYRRMRGEMIKW